MKVTGARVLITGGAGLVGSHLADLLVDRQVQEIVVLDNLSRGRPENLALARSRGKVTLLTEDIRDAAAVRAAMKGIDLVFHQGGLSNTQCAEQPRAAVEVLVSGTFNVLEAAVAAGVHKVVAASTAAVYGEPDYVPIDERHPFNNRTLHGACKIANEQLLRVFEDMYGLQYTALRYFNVYGPRMDVFGAYTEVMIRWLEQIIAGNRPLIFGDGSQSMDFVYVGDVARANLLAMESNVSNEICNVATGQQTSLLELATALLHVLGRGDLTPMHQAERKVNPVRRRQGDVRKAQDLLGFSAQVGLLEGLQALVDWWTSVRAVA
jgi:UDP-glucose 4-epimerase